MTNIDVLPGAMQRESGGSGGDEASRPRKKQRKQRPYYSCDECRRLKMKCDRQVPCSNCVRRNKIESCTGISSSDSHSRFHGSPGEQDVQQTRHSHHSVEHTGTFRSEEIGSNQRPAQQPQQRQSLTISQTHFCPPTMSSLQSSESHPAQIRHQRDSCNQIDLQSYVASRTTIHEPVPLPEDTMAGRTYSIPSAVSASGTVSRSIDDSEQSASHGTLMLTEGGRSKYLGPTAGSEWLKDSEAQDASETPSDTRAPSPEPPQSSRRPRQGLSALNVESVAFPFNSSTARISTRELLSHLPPREEAWTLVESYYRYCAWHHDVAPKALFEKTFDRVYTLASGGSLTPSLNPQEIALVFIILAQGTMFNIEMPLYDSSAEEWLHLSERALVKGEFLSNNMVAGLQTLHLMAHLHLQLDKGRRGDNAWPLWGLVMRLVQAMGMHRDGTRWNLPHDVVEERRKVFWECNAADTFQAHCFSRPCAINPEHCDTIFPSEPLTLNGEKGYSILRFELSQLSSEILNMAMKVRKPEYSDVTSLGLRLLEFERNLPFSLRCRAALLSMPSQYPQCEAAIEASPDPSPRSMTKSFQQTNLALNISETIINLHRPYYAKALYDDISIGVNSIYAPSFLTVIERCTILIAIVTDIHARFPTVSTRQWNFWYHVFGSALCLGTLVLRDPGNPMANFVLAQVDAAIDLFTSLIQHGAKSPRYTRNLQWLSKLRARLSSKISAASLAPRNDARPHDEVDENLSNEDREDDEDAELVGWRTRLVERMGQNNRISRTIHLAPTPTGSQVTDAFNMSPNRVDTVPKASVPPTNLNSTDDLLHDFWDPMLLQDIFEVPRNDANNFLSTSSAWWADVPNASNNVSGQF